MVRTMLLGEPCAAQRASAGSYRREVIVLRGIKLVARIKHVFCHAFRRQMHLYAAERFQSLCISSRLYRQMLRLENVLKFT